MRKTKIVCTLGPAVDDIETLEKMMLAGMNVARINFSHGNYKDQEERINNFKALRDRLGLPIPLLLDTKGPEIRIGKFTEKMVYLKDDESFTLLNEDILGDSTKVSVSYKNLYNEVQPGTTILVNDGTIELNVVDVIGKDIVCRIVHGGKLTNTKSINIPDSNINLPSITEKDIEDVKFGIEAGFDYIAASFVRKPEDVEAIRKILRDNNGEHIKIIAKIENREGINNFDAILEVSDGIMIARGDLGVEIPMEEVPIVQKQFIKKTKATGKPVITATQMLESMITQPRPTRAEVSDVANAIFDGSSAIMLSGESAMGNYPVECVETMSKIACAVEKSIRYWLRFKNNEYLVDNTNYECITNHAICTTAMDMDAKAIVAYTDTGDTSRTLSGFSPKCDMYAITENLITYRQLGLCWGVTPKLFEHQESIEELLKIGIEKLKEEGYLQEGDCVLIAGGNTIIPKTDIVSTNKIIGGILKI